jgi:hypothetical protein
VSPERAGFGTAFVLYLLVWLAVPVPVTLAGTDAARTEWFRWLFSADILIVWWLVPWLAFLLMSDELRRLDFRIQRSALGAWANTVVRYALPLRTREWRLLNSFLVFVSGAVVSLLLFNVGFAVVLLPATWRGPFVGLPIVFALSIAVVLAVASFFVPDADGKRAIDLGIAQVLADRRRRVQPIRDQSIKEWVRLASMLFAALLIISLIVAATMFYSSYEVAEIREMLSQ